MMDFVAAKAILDKFANTFRAAEFMAEALDTAASLERRGMELEQNVAHLLREQAAQQTSLTAMRLGFTQEQEAARALALTRQADRQAEAEQMQTALARQRADTEQALAGARAGLADYSARAEGTLRDLDKQIHDKLAMVASLDGQIEALKAQARQVLN